MALTLFHETTPTEDWEKSQDLPQNLVGFVFSFAPLGGYTYAQLDSQLVYRRCYLFDGRTFTEPMQWGQPQPEDLLFLQWQPQHFILQNSIKNWIQVKALRTQRAKPVTTWHVRCFYVTP